jgi:anti-sigma B factor antagonist
MSVAPPPQRRRWPERFRRGSRDDCVRNEAEVLSWDHFDVQVTDAAVPVVVRCRGGLDFAYTDQLREVFAGITERDVVVDLSHLTFVDSTGLSVLLSARRTLLDVGGSLTIHNATGLVRRVFAVAELDDVLDNCPAATSCGRGCAAPG